MALLTLGDVALNVAFDGDRAAPALLIAHPLGANLHVWDALVPDLAEHFYVVRYDSRGHGGSWVPAGPYSLGDLGGDALALIDALGLEKTHFLGLSMGGLVGEWLLLNAQDRLNRVVLANTASHFPDAAGWNTRIRTVRGGGMAALTPAILPRWLTPQFQAARPDVAAQVEAMLLASDPSGYAACCAALRDSDLRVALRAARGAEVMVIVGEADASAPPERGAALAQSLGAKLVRLNGAHLSCAENAAEFLAAVQTFLLS
jgi:3-oxoadipate enol-lactonase